MSEQGVFYMSVSSEIPFWSYEIRSLKSDFLELSDSLSTTSEKRGLSAYSISHLCLLLEEITQRHLLPAAERLGLDDPKIFLTLHLDRNNQPVLTVSYKLLTALPLNPLDYGGDGLSTYLVRGIASKLPEKEPGVARFRI